ncbi:hypothetical protein JCM8097_009293 [Rhodosporidiobolus ruineniae]
MAAIGLSTFFDFGEAVPSSLVLRLCEGNIASLAACFFCYDIVRAELYKYYRRAWANDSRFWRTAAVLMTAACGIDLALLAAAVGIGLRDLQRGTYSRDAMDALYLAMKVVVWVVGMFSELFFVLRVHMLTDFKVLVWVLYGLTSAPFFAAFVFFLLYRFYEFRFGRYARIMDLVGGWANVFFAAFTVVVLGYRIILQRRKDARPSDDALSELFRGAVATSALIALTSGGAAVPSCFLSTPSAYMISGFFYALYPPVATISCLFALHQRQSLRRRLTPEGAEEYQLGRGVGGGGGGKKGGDGERGRPPAVTFRRTGDDPSEWRGDKVSLGPHVAQAKGSKKEKRRSSKLGGERSFHDMALDTEALRRCEPTRSFLGGPASVHTTNGSTRGGGGGGGGGGIRVHTESIVTVEDERDYDPLPPRSVSPRSFSPPSRAGTDEEDRDGKGKGGAETRTVELV